MLKKSLEKLTDLLFYIAGCGIYSVAVVMFVSPARMSPGGVTGIATVLLYLTGVPTGITVFLINVPLLILAYFKFGKRFLLRTGIATLLLSVELTIAEQIIKPYYLDKILSAVFGGILMGLGLGLVILRSATTGGFDILLKLICRKYPHITFGTLYLILDAIVILLTVIVYGNLETALYSSVCIFIVSKTLDYVVYGSGGGKLILAVTTKEEEISRRITTDIKRGVTAISAYGGYTRSNKKVILCAVRRHQAALVLKMIRETDENAFAVITDAGEISGFGF